MIVTVTLNPAIDRTITIPEFKVNEVNRVASAREDIGGKGVNVSKIVSLLGGKTTAIGFAGGKGLERMKLFLAQQEIMADFVDTSNEVRTNIKIVDPIKNTNTDINDTGIAIADCYIMQLKQKLKKYVKHTKYIVLSGSIPPGIDKNIYQTLINSMPSVPFAIDAQGELLRQGIKASPFLIKPNIDELIDTFGIKISNEEEMIAVTKNLIKKHSVKMALVSMGDNGSLLISEDFVYKAIPIKVDVKSTVAAGDFMLGAFVYWYSQTASAEESLRYAAACGTLAVTTEGTALFSIEDIKPMLEKVCIEKIK